MSTLLLVTYKESGDVECVTTNFNKWLEQHNRSREADGECEEMAHEFDVQEVEFNKYTASAGTVCQDD